MKKKIVAAVIAVAMLTVGLMQIIPALADTAGPLDHVTLTPSPVTLAPAGEQQFVAKGFDSANVEITTGLSYFWMITAGGGSISTTGNFTAGATAGTFANTVQVMAVQGTLVKFANATVTVALPAAGELHHVTITPATVSLVTGTTQEFHAQGFDVNNAAIIGLTYTWAATTAGGTVSAAGVFTAGTTTGTFANAVRASATQGTITKEGAANVTVTPVAGDLHHVTITPATVSLVTGTTQEFHAQGFDVNNVAITGLTYTWTAATAGGTISAAGVFTAGTTINTFSNAVRASATQGTITREGTASVTVTPVAGDLHHVTVTPATVSLVTGTTQEFHAQGFDVNNVAITGLTYTWTAATAGGTVSAAGVFTAGTTINTFSNAVRASATQGTITREGTANVTVTPVAGDLHHVTITPATVSLVTGTTQQFTAQGFDANNVAIAGLTYTWTATTAGGTVSAAGVFTAGTTINTFSNAVRASTTQGTITKEGTANVTVTSVAGGLHHINVTPANVTLAPAAAQQFTAQGFDTNNVALTGLTFTWSATDGGTITTGGLFTAGATTGTFSNAVRATATQGTITKEGKASVKVSTTTGSTSGSATAASTNYKKLVSMFQGFFKGTAFDNFLGGQWQIKNGTAVDTVKAIPGIVQTVTATTASTTLVVIPNGQTAPVTFTVEQDTVFLPKGTLLAPNDKVIVITVNDKVSLISEITTPVAKSGSGNLPPGIDKKNDDKRDGKDTPQGWSQGKKVGWSKIFSSKHDKSDD